MSLAIATRSSLISVTRPEDPPLAYLLDFPNKVELVIDVSALEQLLAQVVAARSEAEILRPFNDGVD